jgi:multidrug resistance efflux pump
MGEIIDLSKIKVGDTLTLRQDYEESTPLIKEKVTEINNPLTKELFSQIRTENLDFNFLHFHTIIKVQ